VSVTRFFLPYSFSTDWCTIRNVVWLADTNYRIDLENDAVRSLAQRDEFDALLAADQVRT
jgi:hypothetical protein